MHDVSLQNMKVGRVVSVKIEIYLIVCIQLTIDNI